MFTQNATVRYLGYGILFGCLFPLTATLFDVWQRDLSLTFQAIVLVQRSQPLHWMIDTAPLFLGLFAALAGRRQDRLLQLYSELQYERTIAVQRANEVQHHLTELQKTYQQLQQAQQTIRALTLPVIPILPGVLVVPLIGTMDTARVVDLQNTLLPGITHHRADHIILDATGLEALLPNAVIALEQLTTAIQLLGAIPIFTGITAEVALQLPSGSFTTRHTRVVTSLAEGIKVVQKHQQSA